LELEEELDKFSFDEWTQLGVLFELIKDGITKWFTKIKEENLKFGKPPIRKNSKPIFYTMPPLDVSESEIPTTDEIKSLFGQKNNVTDKLNYFRI
jgi:hypothetical protein